MYFSASFTERAIPKLTVLYGADAAHEILTVLDERLNVYRDAPPDKRETLWNEQDVLLITYGDQVRDKQAAALQSLHAFLKDNQLDEVINTVHILPFFPYSSDDGFSVIDYKQVDPELGNWNDIAALGSDFSMMFDLVLNHCSQQHQWFQGFLNGTEPYVRYFLVGNPTDDLSQVTRPRSTPLLSPYRTARGVQNVWTTFSADQVDLNFAEPAVLIEMLDILMDYVNKGARFIRLDAIAYLWKQPGTTCIHLKQTHLVVKLMRDLLDELAPGTILLTETNVPHVENVSYFGTNDEAHMVYQFSLAPLLLDAFLQEDARYINKWLSELEPTSAGTTFLNFTASHDGIGVRPLEGLVPHSRLENLVEIIKAQGGRVSTKRNPDGSESPYELNCTYFSALATEDPHWHVDRFLASQAVMLALRGIPAIYFHSLVGTPNYTVGVAKTGRARTINRRKYLRQELDSILSDESTLQQEVFLRYQQLLAVRIQQPAFHPDADQQPIDIGQPGVIAFLRTSSDLQQKILCIANVTTACIEINLKTISDCKAFHDLLNNKGIADDFLILSPGEFYWLDC